MTHVLAADNGSTNPAALRRVSQQFTEYKQPLEDEILARELGHVEVKEEYKRPERIGLVPRAVMGMQERGARKKMKADVKDEALLQKLGFAYIGRSVITVWHRPTFN